MAQKTLPTRNEDYGFFGTLITAGETDHAGATTAFADAAEFLQATYRMSPEMARDFLDDKFGRHLADHIALRSPSTCPWLAETVRHFRRTYSPANYANLEG